MKTDICKNSVLNIQFYMYCRDVVVASKAEVLSSWCSGYSPEQLKEELDWIDENIGDYPYGVDTVIPQKYEAYG